MDPCRVAVVVVAVRSLSWLEPYSVSSIAAASCGRSPGEVLYLSPRRQSETKHLIDESDVSAWHHTQHPGWHIFLAKDREGRYC